MAFQEIDMVFQELQSVVLNRNLGAVVQTYKSGGLEVEFVSAYGNAAADAIDEHTIAED